MTRRVVSWCLAVFLSGRAAFAGPLLEAPEPPASASAIPAAAQGLPQAAAPIDPLSAAASSIQTALAPVPEAAPLSAQAPRAEASAPIAASQSAALALDAPAVSFDGAQRAARLKLQAQRAVTLPAHVWPFTALARKISHGEGLAGLTPAGAVRAAEEIAADRGAPTVAGRLSWELHDSWSVRGAARSYARLLDAVAAAKAKNPKLDVAVSLDVEALGGQLDGVSSEERTRVAKANAIALARRARDLGISVELDIGASALMPLLLEVSQAVVRELRMPVRLALAARYLASEKALRDWAALARETGLKLGVRLVKGSFIEGDRPETLYLRRPLLDQYKKLVTQALALSPALDVAVATHNEEIWRHAQAESRRLDAPFTLQTIRGVNPQLQAKMRASGNVPREYVSYGVDTPVMALMEMWTNWRQKRALRKRVAGELD